MKRDCKDLFHKLDSAPRIEYAFHGPGQWTGTGYECPTCHMRTSTLVDDSGKDITPVFATRSVGWKWWALPHELLRLGLFELGRYVPGTRQYKWRTKK